MLYHRPSLVYLLLLAMSLQCKLLNQIIAASYLQYYGTFKLIKLHSDPQLLQSTGRFATEEWTSSEVNIIKTTETTTIMNLSSTIRIDLNSILHTHIHESIPKPCALLDPAPSLPKEVTN